MTNPVNRDLARFASDIQEAYEAICERYPDEFFTTYQPSIRLYSYGDLAAEFYEEGIEFYPKEDKA